jgi:hypothetical protein
MISPDIGSYTINIINGLCVHESSAIVFDSRESVKVLHEMFADFESSFWSLCFNEEFSVELHGFEYFCEDRASSIWEKTPRIPK